jgi:hypothetical protein
MQFLSFQNNQIPLHYVTGFSYTKTARTALNSSGFARFLGFEPAEISVRVIVNNALAMVTGRDLHADLISLLAITPDVNSEPTQVTLGGFLIYPSLLFRVTSVNRTIASDRGGFPIEAEIDLVLSGVECAKQASSQRAFDFTNEDVIQIPAVSLTCEGKTYTIKDDSTLSVFTLTPYSCEIEANLGADSAIVDDNSWLVTPAANNAIITIEGYGDFYAVSLNLIDGVLSIIGSVWPKETVQPLTKTYRNTTVSAILRDIFPYCKTEGLNGVVDYCLIRSRPLQTLNRLRESAGFLTSFVEGGLTFAAIPDTLTPNIDFDLYLDEDVITEPISGIVWRDNYHEKQAGNVDKSAAYIVDSVFASNDSTHAQNCLKYAQYMQNKITITIPYDERIRQHSVFYVIKDSAAIPVMVENYVVDFLSNQMALECHYTKRG